ncbi:MAG TPA: hypothetical protein VFX41_05475 [Actinomycetales bacterium]|jgi:hypothetical protein|nr:hypothetical protein [Actinomycetales bacterium]
MYPTHPLLMLAVGTERRNDMLRDAEAFRIATAASQEFETHRRRNPQTRVSASTRFLTWSRLRLRHP